MSAGSDFTRSTDIPRLPRRVNGWWEPRTEEELKAVLALYASSRSGHDHDGRRGSSVAVETEHDHKQSAEDLGPDPEWDDIGERGETAKQLYEGGLKSKAYRYGRCDRYAIPLQGHQASCDLKDKTFVRYRCGLRFCDLCGPSTYTRLFDRYAPAVTSIVEAHSCREGYTLARVNLTIRATDEVPTSEETRAFNRAIRELFRQVLPKGAAYGLVWSDELGPERHGHVEERKAGGMNLHAHGLYFGAYLNWYKVRDAWIEITGSRGFYITEIKGWKKRPRRGVFRALGHLLKYVSKMPAVTPQRTAAYEKAFDGVRRVHSMGLFYRLPKVPLEKRSCPRCGNELFPLFPFEVRLVADLQAAGWRDLDEVRREIGQKCAFGGDP
jgi:hypothetical protein